MHGLIVEDAAERFLKKLDRHEQERVVAKLEDLQKNPRLGKPLVGNLAGLWELRVGSLRAIYKVVEQELVILVLDLDYRKRVFGRKWKKRKR
ncbi:type II toxin-antitoxin system mRNA interferase toxin, RelE/StbE family [Candidatus Pacearchaeota archaeon]|nr:type II toxin-antitoxin system mRNA interferase toxin, RelE/StbE family [Candidatus Pacearchaeota archaeon]